MTKLGIIEELKEQVKNFDPSEIQPDNFGSWPLFVKLLAWFAAFALTLFAGYYLIVGGLITERDMAIAKEQSLKREYEKKAYDAANLEAYRAQMKEMELAFSALISQLPSETEVPGLLEDITEKGASSGLEFDNISLLPEVVAEFYVEQPISIKALGTYHDMGTFISGVASLPRIVTLKDFSLKPVTAGGGSAMLSLDISASTYRYKGE